MDLSTVCRIFSLSLSLSLSLSPSLSLSLFLSFLPFPLFSPFLRELLWSTRQKTSATLDIKVRGDRDRWISTDQGIYLESRIIPCEGPAREKDR